MKKNINDGINLTIGALALVGLSVPGYMIGRFIGNRKGYKMGQLNTINRMQDTLIKVLGEKADEENEKED